VRLKRIAPVSPDAPYIIEVHRGCEVCQCGTTWDVVERTTNTEMASFQNNIDAEEFVELLTGAWQHGRDAAVIEFAFSDDDRSRYNELLSAVGHKFHGESRYETALRYIRQAEQSEGPAKESR